MPLIKCPDCGNTVSDKTITCLKCGRPIASTLSPVSPPAVQTIEKTSKKLKGWLAAWIGIVIGSMFMMFLGGSMGLNWMMGAGLVLFLVSASGFGVVQVKIWWEHE